MSWEMLRRHVGWGRIGWGLLTAIHVPIFLKVCGAISQPADGPAAWGSAIALGLTLGFFLLKLWDVAFLRLPDRRHSALVFFLIAAFVHHDVRSAVTSNPVLAEVTVIAASALVVRSRHIWARALARGCFSPATGEPPRWSPGSWLVEGPIHFSQILRASLGAPRAPPA